MLYVGVSIHPGETLGPIYRGHSRFIGLALYITPKDGEPYVE